MQRTILAALAAMALLPVAVQAADDSKPAPPKSWVDKDTGHRIWRLSDEPNSGGFYFNVNGYTPDLKQMIYTAPDGIHVLDMTTHATKLLVANPPRPASAPPGPGGFMRYGVHALVAGYKTNSVFYTQTDPATNVTSVYKADVYSGAIRKLVDLPEKRMIVSINADETLAAGTYIEGDAPGQDYGSNPARARAQWRQARRHHRSFALYRLGQPPALLAYGSNFAHVLPRRPLAKS
jgi:oligogalacturonide lyase